jgi:hypothetical protein
MSDGSDVEMKNAVDDELTDEARWQSCNELVTLILNLKASPKPQSLGNNLLHLNVGITPPGTGLFDEQRTLYRLSLSSSQPRVDDYVQTWRVLVAALTRQLVYEVARRPQARSVIFESSNEEEIWAFTDALETSEIVPTGGTPKGSTRAFRWDAPLLEGPPTRRTFVSTMTQGIHFHPSADDAFDERTYTLQFDEASVVTIKLERFRDDPLSTQTMDMDDVTDRSFSSVYSTEVRRTEDVCRRLLNTNLLTGRALYTLHITSPFGMNPSDVVYHPNVQEFLWYVFRVASIMAWPVLVDGDIYREHLSAQGWTHLGPAFPIVFYHLEQIGQLLWVFQPRRETRSLSEVLQQRYNESDADSSDIDLSEDLETRLLRSESRPTPPKPKKQVISLLDSSSSSSEEDASDHSPDLFPTLTMTDVRDVAENDLMSIFDDIQNLEKRKKAKASASEIPTIPPLQDRDSPRELSDVTNSSAGPLPLKRNRDEAEATDQPASTTTTTRDTLTPFYIYTFLDTMAEQLRHNKYARLVEHQCVIEAKLVNLPQINHTRVLLEFTNLSLNDQLNNDSSIYCFFRAVMQRVTLPMEETPSDPFASLDGIALSAVAMGTGHDQRFRRIGFTVDATSSFAERYAQWLKPIAPRTDRDTTLKFFRAAQFGDDGYLPIQFNAPSSPDALVLQFARGAFPARDIVHRSGRDTRHFDQFAKTVAQTCSTLGNREMLLLNQPWPNCVIIDRLHATRPESTRFMDTMLSYIIALARIMSWPIYVHKKANADVVDYLEKITYRRPVWNEITSVDYYCWVPKYEPMGAENPRTLISSRDLDDSFDEEERASKKLKGNDVVFHQCAHCETREARFRAGHLFLCGRACYSEHFGL